MTQDPIISRPADTRKRAARIAIGAIACIPLIYGGSLIWANQDPTHRLDKIPAAVVDLDQPATHGGTAVDVGKTVAHDLVTNHQDDNFDWTETSASAASAGLKNGTYLAEVTLPKDMSANAVSLGGNADQASDSQIKITTNDGQNFIVGIAAKTIGLTVAQNASAGVAQQYLSQIYSGLDQISAQLTDAAGGAKQLAAGASTLQGGAAQLAAGAGSLSSGASQLASGASQASSGASQLAAGLGSAQSGANRLASGTAQLAAGTSQLQSQTAAAADGAAQLAAGNAKLAAGAKALSAPLDQAQALTSSLPVSASQLATDGSALSSGLAQYAGTASQLLSTCSSLSGQSANDATAQQLCSEIDQLAGPNGTSTAALTKDAQELGNGVAQLPQLVNGINQAAGAANALTSGAEQASAGANQLANKLRSGESGAAALNSGAQQAASGASTLAGRLGTATNGASSLASGTAKLASGAGALDSGASRLQSGAESLDSGAGQLASGAGTLASKLASGAASVPDYSPAQASHLSKTAAQPIALAQTKLNAVPSYGYGLSPYFLALGAWVGGLSIYMILRAIPLSAIERGRPAWAAALLGYLRGAWVSLAQMALLYFVVTVPIGVHPQNPVGLAMFLGLAGLAFTAVNHALMTVFGSRGRFLGLILLVLQVAAAGATYPVQTTPVFFQMIHGLLPMTYAANAIRSLIAGGGAGVAQGITVLTCWLFVSLAISVGVSVTRHARRTQILIPDFVV